MIELHNNQFRDYEQTSYDIIINDNNYKIEAEIAATELGQAGLAIDYFDVKNFIHPSDYNKVLKKIIELKLKH